MAGQSRRRLLRFSRRLVFWGGAVGVGAVSVIFAKAADWAQGTFLVEARLHWALPLVLTPLGFLFCTWAAQEFFPGAQGSGIPQAIAARHLPRGELRSGLLSMRVCFGKIILTTAGLLCGASVGREGPTVQLGAGIMLQVSRLRGLTDERGLILAGSAAGIAAAFNAPLAGVVFAIEEMSKAFEARANGLVLTTVIIAGLVSLGVTGNYTYFGTAPSAAVTAQDWAIAALCGAVGGMAGGTFSHLMMRGLELARRWIAVDAGKRRLILPLACGLLVALIGLASGGQSFGTSYAQARAAVEGTAPAWYFWPAKFAATLITAISGIPGGIFAPSLAVGAGLGAWVAGGLGVSLGAVLGMAGYFAGVVQAPMTAFVIVLEMTGNNANVIPLMLASVIGLGASKLVCPAPLYHTLARGFLPQAEG